MTKNVTVKLCIAISSILVLCFLAKTGIDYAQYTTTLNSAPFSIQVAINALCFVLPALIIFTIAITSGIKMDKST